MKPIKLFSTLKSGVGAAALAIAAFAFLSCQNMTTPPAATMVATASKTLYPPTFPEHTTDNEGNPIAVTYAERYYTVSQGQKRKISLSWTPVGIAKYYEVYAAENITDTFVKVGETTKTEFDDSVGSGKTYYYKVRAANSRGEYSEFSSVVRGTSLATPAITDISILDTSATVFWYMGNVSVDSYVKNLVYEIHAFKDSEEKVVTFEAWDAANERAIEEYTFENLSGNSEYMFRVDAYTKADTSKIESSPKVSQKTLSLYKPVSPEFTASQGESVQSVKLRIKLPTKIQVQEEADVEYDYPICFKVQRKKNNEEEWSTIVPCLYFTGKLAAPSKDDYDSYKEGDVIEWEDSVIASANSIKRGIKYDYRVISCVDLNFSKVNTYNFSSTVESKEKDANIATGWAAYEAAFAVKEIQRTINPNNSDYISNVAVTFTASWDALGKDSLYKFAVKQDFKRASDNAEGSAWLSDAQGNKMFDTAEAVNALVANYDLTSGAEFLCGTYEYTLYIISKEYTNPSTAIDSNNYLTCTKDRNKVSVSENANLPNADLQAEGGWTNKAKLSWFAESGVSYKLLKTDITAGTAETTIDNDQILTGIGATEFPLGAQTNFYDTDVVSGHKYSYTLEAAKGSSKSVSLAQTVETLGTAAPSVSRRYYNQIVVSWPTVMAAQHYDITLGKKNDFGNGASITLDQAGQVVSSSLSDGSSAEVELESDVITLTIKKPYGFNDATLSGKASDIEIESSSDVGKDTTKAKKSVWTIGPATTAIAGTDTTQRKGDNITVTWRGLEGAAGYAVYRTRQAIPGSVDKDGNVSNLAAEKTDVYYVSADATTVKVNETADAGNAAIVLKTADSAGATYTLTDNYTASNDPSDQWKASQSYIGLGIKYTYTVLPVLEESDAKSISDNLMEECAVAGEAYKNFSKIQTLGYTTGFGLNLEASKAEYTDRVVLTWDAPANNDIKARSPTVYYKAKKNTAWIKIDDLESTKNYYIFKKDILPEATRETDWNDVKWESMEFAVTYNGSFATSTTTTGIDSAYKDYLAKIEDARIVSGEAKNIGYLFTLPELQGSKEEKADYSETATWKTYNTESNVDRAVGPENYSLKLKNLNNNSDYKTLVTYDANGENGTAQNYSWGDASITAEAASGTEARKVTVKPNFLNNDAGVGVHNGLLKVQRDYKHYYQIVATRTSKADFYKFSEFDDSVIEKPDSTVTAYSEDYACRKITDQEFAKCVSLIVADALHKVSGKEGTLDSKYGSGTFKTNVPYKTAVPAVYNIEYKFENFKNIFAKLPGSDSPLQSDFTLNGTSTKEDGYTYSNIVYQLGSCAISVTHETGFKSYQGTVTLAAGRYHGYMTFVVPNYETKWDLSLKFKNQTTGAIEETVTASDDADKFKLWFPFALWTDLGTTQNDGTGNFPTMSGTWWQEQ